MEPKTCQKGPKVGSEYWPTFKTSHCVRTACMAFPYKTIGTFLPRKMGHERAWAPQVEGIGAVLVSGGGPGRHTAHPHATCRVAEGPTVPPPPPEGGGAQPSPPRWPNERSEHRRDGGCLGHWAKHNAPQPPTDGRSGGAGAAAPAHRRGPGGGGAPPPGGRGRWVLRRRPPPTLTPFFAGGCAVAAGHRPGPATVGGTWE